MYLKIILQLIGGLGLFLYGMEHMSTSMQKIAGPKLKKILASLTNNRVLGILVGIIITALVQSSSVSTVMTVGFVNASLLTLKQALGVILGTNIGTTITGWLLALNIGKYGLPIVGLASILFMFMKKEKARTNLSAIIGVGLIFFGLQLMSQALSPLKDMPEFIEMFKMFKVDSYFGLLKVAATGAIITALIQSSAATIGITIALATQGLIDYPAAVALVLGENVGTTVTALLASIGAKPNAKRAHTLINLIGVLWVTSIFRIYLHFLNLFIDPVNHMGAAIAAAHTIFNISNVIILTPFVSLLDKFLLFVVKDTGEDELIVTKLASLKMTLPSVIIEQTKIEVNSMVDMIENVFLKLEESLKEKDKIAKYNDNIVEAEDKLDLYEKEIYDSNFSLLSKSLSKELIEDTRMNLLACDEYETIGDYQNRIANRLFMLYENSIELDEVRAKMAFKLHSLSVELFNDISRAVRTNEKELYPIGMKKYQALKAYYKEVKREHFSRAENIPARLNTGYLDIINYYKRIADHTYNIIEYVMKI